MNPLSYFTQFPLLSRWRLDPPHSRQRHRPAAGVGASIGYGVSEVGIAVRNLKKSFGDFHAVDDVSFEIPNGQLVGLLGPSGSGKSTILRIIAGLEAPDSGTVELIGEDATHLPTRERGIGFVFQHYALFRHMSVRQNIAFGLEVQKRPKPEIQQRVDELLRLVQLAPHADRYPSQLSGGQRQRVALARALAARPKVLLLDEPFGALDARVRDELRAWLRRLHDEIHVTSLFVTHDQQEAFEVADQVVILNKGKVEQIGPPQDLYERPATPFVTEFLGAVNRMSSDLVTTPSLREGPVAYVRPHDFDVNRIGYDDGIGVSVAAGIPAQVKRLTPLGGHVRVDVVMRDDRSELNIQLTRERFVELALTPGDEIVISPKNVKTFRSEKLQAVAPDYII